MITLKHPTSGVLKKCPTGFSFTTLLFGMFVPLFRGDFKWFGIWILAWLLILMFTDNFAISDHTVGAMGLGLSAGFAQIYNTLYIKGILGKGYIPADKESRIWLEEHNIIAKETSENEHS